MESDTLLAAVAGVDEGATLETVVAAHGMIDNMLARLKELKRDLDASTIRWINVHGPFTVDQTEWFVAHPSEKEVPTPHDVLDDLLPIADVGGIKGAMSTNAWKPGALEKLFVSCGRPDLAAKHVVKVVHTKLEKKLVKVNKAFVGR